MIREVCGSTTTPWFVRTNAWNGRRTVSQDELDGVIVAVVDPEEMMVSAGGMSDNDGGMPFGYRVAVRSSSVASAAAARGDGFCDGD